MPSSFSVPPQFCAEWSMKWVRQDLRAQAHCNRIKEGAIWGQKEFFRNQTDPGIWRKYNWKARQSQYATVSVMVFCFLFQTFLDFSDELILLYNHKPSKLFWRWGLRQGVKVEPDLLGMCDRSGKPVGLVSGSPAHVPPGQDPSLGWGLCVLEPWPLLRGDPLSASNHGWKVCVPEGWRKGRGFVLYGLSQSPAQSCVCVNLEMGHKKNWALVGHLSPSLLPGIKSQMTYPERLEASLQDEDSTIDQRSTMSAWGLTKHFPRSQLICCTQQLWPVGGELIVLWGCGWSTQALSRSVSLTQQVSNRPGQQASVESNSSCCSFLTVEPVQSDPALPCSCLGLFPLLYLKHLSLPHNGGPEAVPETSPGIRWRHWGATLRTLGVAWCCPVAKLLWLCACLA